MTNVRTGILAHGDHTQTRSRRAGAESVELQSVDVLEVERTFPGGEERLFLSHVEVFELQIRHPAKIEGVLRGVAARRRIDFAQSVAAAAKGLGVARLDPVESPAVDRQVSEYPIAHRTALLLASGKNKPRTSSKTRTSSAPVQADLPAALGVDFRCDGSHR